MENLIKLIPLFLIFSVFMIFMFLADRKTLNIKSKTVGDGQHGSASFATPKEISKSFKRVNYEPNLWREGKTKDLPQGIIIGCNIVKFGKKKKVSAIVDEGDVHSLMIGAAGVGKTAKFLYPNIEYCCATGMSFVTSDTKGDLLRSYAPIAKKYYGYDISVLDLRNPTQSDGFNMLHMVNRYMDEYLQTNSLVAKAKAEKYAKIISKTIMNSGGFDSANAGQNAFFYDSAEGLITSVILVIAEFCSPYAFRQKENENNSEEENIKAKGEERHIISVFKLIQDLLAPSEVKGKSQFKLLMEKLPEEHKARWLSGAALNTSDQAMASVLSTALSRLNAFLDSEIEQLLCFETKIDTEKFCKNKSAVFLIMPEEDDSKYFLISLIVQQLYREMLSIADEMGGKLPNRVMFFLDEFGTLPAIQSAEMMFSASRSRRISFIPIIQSLAQLEKNYGKEGADIIIDNCQICIYGGFAPNSEAANVLSKTLGDRTVMTGSISQGKDKSKSLQMTGRPLMTPDELKTMPKDTFIVTRTGVKPMKTKLHLFFEWGIELNEKYPLREAVVRKVVYANKKTIEKAILRKYGEEVMNITTEENENLPLKAGIKDILRNMKE
ncbi:conjugal transfer protein TraG [Tyzzerella sp. An114]|uniref:VirD4-like conjugal transfer protein, CD1115 family n=1 Tax=Tyzzerella sp. An114 TaxID=1965545 RepID=UPI000B56389F|nr:conjugal transfer protein TraG [Tyzzerella sp. An114]